MKSSLGQKESIGKSKYPYLGFYDQDFEVVVLFGSMKYGMVVHTTNPDREVGQVQANWNEEDFIPFVGQVILEN